MGEDADADLPDPLGTYKARAVSQENRRRAGISVSTNRRSVADQRGSTYRGIERPREARRLKSRETRGAIEPSGATSSD